MAIDTMIGYPCAPKQAIGEKELIERLKGYERARLIIRMYRDEGDQRPPSQMGFDITRRTPQGEETQLIVVQELLDAYDELMQHAHHCQGCPANRKGVPFGCASYIEYPISAEAEAWMLNQLPKPDDALLWLLLRQGIDDFGYDGQDVAALRQQDDTYFEERQAPSRRLGEFDINANQVFEMTFLVGDLNPNHAGVLLLFFGAIARELEANQIMRITPAPADALERFPLLIHVEASDDLSTAQVKEFLVALYDAWRLNVPMQVDP